MEALDFTTESSLGSRLLETRAKLKMSQAQFAELCGVSKSSQSLYEKNTNKPDASYLEHLYARGVDLNWLIGGDSTQLKKGITVKTYSEVAHIVYAWLRNNKRPLSDANVINAVSWGLELCQNFGKVDAKGIETLLEASFNA